MFGDICFCNKNDKIMKTLKLILIKIAWLLIYWAFNIGLFLVEVSVLFKKRTKSNKSNTGADTLDFLLDVGIGFLDALSGLAVFIHGCLDSVIALVTLLFFIPVQLKYIKPNYQTGSKKKFLYSLLASLVVLMLLKLIMYIWIFIDGNYV